MTKRKPLNALSIATTAKGRSQGQEPEPIPVDKTGGTITTAIHIPRRTWQLMRAVAFHRAQLNGGRASVSALITEMLERHRKELEQEINR